jgi:hypothetical protein
LLSCRKIFSNTGAGFLGGLSRAAVKAISVYFEALAGEPLVPGIIVAVQTFGDRINFHPHLHLLVTEGGMDRAGVFHRLPHLDDSRLAEIFAREVLRLLVGKGLLSPEWAERILSWRTTGFNVHSYKFIARVTSHIPDKGQVTVRYYGLYANAHRGKVRKAGVSSLMVADPPVEYFLIRIWFFDALSESAFSMRFSPPTIVGKYR